jgi:hypothetical protein
MLPKELNKKLSTISRVVVHPKYRSISPGAKLVRETLPLAGTPYVEMVAVMAKYNPFAEKAGMQRTVFQVPGKEPLKIASALEHLGFNTKSLSSESYVLQRLENLTSKQLAELKDAFILNRHPCLAKEIATNRHKPFGTKANYIEGIKNADLSRIAKFIKVVGILLQVKAYLFWSIPEIYEPQ